MIRLIVDFKLLSISGKTMLKTPVRTVVSLAENPKSRTALLLHISAGFTPFNSILTTYISYNRLV